jgi:hypothetical protein
MSGTVTDEHGTPVMVSADREGVTPQELADRNNALILDDYVRLGADVDAPLTKDFKFVTTALNVKRDRGPPRPLKTITTDGQKIYLGPGGVPSPAGRLQR